MNGLKEGLSKQTEAGEGVSLGVAAQTNNVILTSSDRLKRYRRVNPCRAYRVPTHER
jgi:hypothetical protein